jgi:hypothetical protein
MTRKQAAKILDMLLANYDSNKIGVGKALDLAIAALREHSENESADQQLDSLIDELDEGNMTLNELRERLLKWKNGFIAALRESAYSGDPSFGAADTYAAAKWNIKEHPNEYDKAREDFLAGYVRGRAPHEIEWKPGPPDMSGDYILITQRWPRPNWVVCEPDDQHWGHNEVLFHIGPIPKTPDHV